MCYMNIVGRIVSFENFLEFSTNVIYDIKAKIRRAKVDLEVREAKSNVV